MDTMETTKIVAALCAALLFFLGVRYFVAEPIFRGHDDRPAAFVLAVEETAPAAEEAAAIDFAALVAAADAAAGEKNFGKCKACHSLEAGDDGTGPSLYAIVGKAVGTQPEFGYSEAMAGLGGEWTPERLAEFLHSPKAFAKGTKMTFPGFKDPADAANMVAFLATVK
jgi:cytochrome c